MNFLKNIKRYTTRKYYSIRLFLYKFKKKKKQEEIDPDTFIYD